MKLVGYRMAEGSGIGRLDGESKLVPLGSVEQFWVNPHEPSRGQRRKASTSPSSAWYRPCRPPHASYASG